MIAGFGFMGRTHAAVIAGLPQVHICAVLDPRGGEIAGDLEQAGIQSVPVFRTLGEALRESACSVVNICLPTDLHRDAALQALGSGCHVFCEKPIALTSSDAKEMVDAAKSANRELMVGHCIRFWPEYEFLKSLVDSAKYGRLLSLSLSRRNSRPSHSVGGWVNDPARCVGAALDMHIHDTDFVCYLLGRPQMVSAHSIRENTGWNSIASHYDFGPHGPLVFADGTWNYPTGWGFQMSFSAVFEHAAVDYDSRANPTLTLTESGLSPEPVALPSPKIDGYHRELEYFFECLNRSLPVKRSTGRDASESLEVVLAEIESAAAGGAPIPLSN